MASSSIFFNICEIQNNVISYRTPKGYTHLYDYKCGSNIYCQKIYFSVEIRPESLDKEDGIRGDHVEFLIGKKLGGCGDGYNVLPLNSQLDTSSWRADEDLVYAHLKQGGNRHARLIYGIEFDKQHDDERRRAHKIYYNFQLYENGEAFGQAIEGLFENTSPKVTNPEDHCYYYSGEKRYFKDNKRK